MRTRKRFQNPALAIAVAVAVAVGHKLKMKYDTINVFAHLSTFGLQTHNPKLKTKELKFDLTHMTKYNDTE
jgi:hypothetical protein